MAIIQLPNATIIKEPEDKPYHKKAPKGSGLREVIEGEKGISHYCVYARFELLERDKDSNVFRFKTRGTSTYLSLYTMVQGLYHLSSFAEVGTEVSEDFNDITSDQVLRLPMDYFEASKYIEENLLGKTLRVIARSPAGSTKFGTRYYLFIVED